MLITFNNGIAGLDIGWLISETGTMYSGKSTALINKVTDWKRADQYRVKNGKMTNKHVEPLTFGVYKHRVDNRYAKNEIVSHTGIKLPAKPISTIEELITDVEKNDYRVVAIDEVQFFNEKDENMNYLIPKVLTKFANDKRLVIVSGLSRDFRGETFYAMGDIISNSDEMNNHLSTCVECGSPATLPQRFIDGQPAHYNDPIVLVGGSESYEPRCRNCHVVSYHKIKKEDHLVQSLK